MKEILLINPHETEQLGFTNPPLGLLYLAGTLEKNGFSVRILDACVEGKDAVRRVLAASRPDMVGITCLTPGRHQALELARTTKQFDPSITVVLGGVHPTIMYRQLLEQYSFIDCVVRGEGEEALLELAQENDITTIKGIAFRKDGEVFKTPARENIKNIDDIPVPAWHLTELMAQQFVFTARRSVSMALTRERTWQESTALPNARATLFDEACLPSVRDPGAMPKHEATV